MSSRSFSDEEARENTLTTLLPQPVYQALRNHFLKPHKTVHVTQYFFHEWFSRLGLQRWLLVLILREALSTSDEEDVVRVTREDLAARLECSEKTVSDLLRHIPHPTRKGWRAIDPKDGDGELDPRRQALSLFIPRLRYWYEKREDSDAPPIRRGFIIAVSIDDPLTPEDKARIGSLSIDEIGNIVAGDVTRRQDEGVESRTGVPERNYDPSGATPKRKSDLLGTIPEENYDTSGPTPERNFSLLGAALKGKGATSGDLKGSNDSILLTLTELTNYIQDIDDTLTSTLEIRRTVTPIVQFAEEALADFHSTGMFYKVLCALYPTHLDLFVQALGEAMEVGVADQSANLGAIFVETIKDLARQENVDLGFASTNTPGDVPVPATDGENDWTAEKLWEQAKHNLKLQMTQATFNQLLRGSRGVAWDGEKLIVQLHLQQAKTWLENRLQPTIVDSVHNVVGHDVEVMYEVED